MVTSGVILDDAIALLDTIISRLRVSVPPLQRDGVENGRACPSAKPTVSSVVTQVTWPGSEASQAAFNGPDFTEDFNKAHLQVGQVVSVEEHPIAEKLYVCKLEISKGEFKQVVAGLKKFLSQEELLGEKVCLVLNLKPAKLVGQLSEAMILAGEAAYADGLLNVKILQPPPDSCVGDRIYLEGSLPSAKPAKHLSSKIWEKILLSLSIEAGVAKFNHRSLVTSSGVVTAPDLPDGSSIH